MAENLKYTTSNSWCYDDDSSNCATYGRLYTWAAAKTACPLGWHLPSDAEWTKLTTYLGGEDTAGGKLKSTSTWRYPNTGATNSTGFTGLPGGMRGIGAFDGIGFNGNWWTATESDDINAWNRVLTKEDAGIVRFFSGLKGCGFSVRCIRNY